jgi:hypothetical protein
VLCGGADGCKVVVSGGGSDKWRWVDWFSGYTGAVRVTVLGRRGRCWKKKRPRNRLLNNQLRVRSIALNVRSIVRVQDSAYGRGCARALTTTECTGDRSYIFMAIDHWPRKLALSTGLQRSFAIHCDRTLGQKV